MIIDTELFERKAILLASVEHSGTKALMEELGWQRDGRGRQSRPFAEAHKLPPGGFLNAHLYTQDMPDILAYAKSYLVIVPWRPYEDIKASWISRGRESELDLLNEQLSNLEELLKLKPRVVQLSRETGATILEPGLLWP